MKIVFFGTPVFAARHLEALVEQGIEVVAVVTKPDKPQGRNLVLQAPPVKTVAEKLLPQVPVFQPEKCSTPEFVEVLKAFQADLYVVVAYGEIIKQAVLDLPPLGSINVHASLLPFYRGAAPIQRCLINGEAETGISIIKLVLKMDAGDVVCMEKIPITPNTTFPELEEDLCTLGCKCLLKTIHNFEKGLLEGVPQDHNLATFASKITPEESQIDWRRSGIAIHNLIRGVTPHPGAWCNVLVRGQKKRLKILRSEYYPELNQMPGSVLGQGKNALAVACGEGGIWLKIVQLEGKQAMPITEVLKGISGNEISFIL